MPKVIKVIECDEQVGKGIPEDPYRIVRRYYTLTGTLLAEWDDRKDEIAEDNYALGA